ncbi:hypothetical protein SKAU_G00322710 [Synaphobranchus kaupii]|uniref:Uncharacterized protein n=1 Tax=Synaphobranchus kaupii TaxID=118154 RepID=A0A9Q1IHS9_SYNKA|nr:hypothetical protein SKAU_G00322710 [Synaphobranchus kaupii]
MGSVSACYTQPTLLTHPFDHLSIRNLLPAERRDPGFFQHSTQSAVLPSPRPVGPPLLRPGDDRVVTTRIATGGRAWQAGASARLKTAPAHNTPSAPPGE